MLVVEFALHAHIFAHLRYWWTNNYSQHRLTEADLGHVPWVLRQILGAKHPEPNNLINVIFHPPFKCPSLMAHWVHLQKYSQRPEII